MGCHENEYTKAGLYLWFNLLQRMLSEIGKFPNDFIRRI